MDNLNIKNENKITKRSNDNVDVSCFNHNINKKYSFFEELENRNESIRLWKAVVMQALVDLGSKSNKKMAKIHRIRSIMWFNLTNKDFLTACSYASLDPYYVYQKAQKIKKENPLI